MESARQRKGQPALDFLKLDIIAQTDDSDTLRRSEYLELGVGALACYRQSILLPRLPKTRSGKILRKTLKQILNHEPVQTPPTIEDPAAIDDVYTALAS